MEVHQCTSYEAHSCNFSTMTWHSSSSQPPELATYNCEYYIMYTHMQYPSVSLFSSQLGGLHRSILRTLCSKYYFTFHPLMVNLSRDQQSTWCASLSIVYQGATSCANNIFSPIHSISAQGPPVSQYFGPWLERSNWKLEMEWNSDKDMLHC
jgi:hypothetical protein